MEPGWAGLGRPQDLGPSLAFSSGSVPGLPGVRGDASPSEKLLEQQEAWLQARRDQGSPNLQPKEGRLDSGVAWHAGEEPERPEE